MLPFKFFHRQPGGYLKMTIFQYAITVWPSGAHAPWHRHSTKCHYWVLKGRLMEWTGTDVHPQELTMGQSSLLQPGMGHSVMAVGRMSTWVFHRYN